MQLNEGLRLGMRRLASGVCVISTQSQGTRYAMTASSVTSLSDSPASILVCVNKSAAIHPVLVKGQPLAINVLSAHQQDVSNTCAGKEALENRFKVGEWGEDNLTQLPYLTTSQAVFMCEVDNEDLDYGTHQIVICRLTSVVIPEVDFEPLIYADGKYQELKK